MTTPLLDPTNYPLFKGWSIDGNLGAGYKVYAYEAGTSTPTATYSDYGRTTPNTWPVVLNSVGEAIIYLAVTTDLVYTDPNDVVIWTFPSLFAPTGNFYSGNGVRNADNVYAVTLSPPLLSLPSVFQLVMVPDSDNLDTMENPNKATAQVFTGSGVNDLTWTGPYTGTTAGSVFTVAIDSVSPAIPTALTATLAGLGAGNLSNGIYSYVVTYITAQGETQAGIQSTNVEVTSAGTNGQLALTGIPVSADATVTDRKLYRTRANGTVYYFLHTMGDNSTTTYTDNTADASLSTQVPAVTLADTFKWKKDGGSWTEKVSINAAAVPQSLIEGIFVSFADVFGHTLGDIWSLTVMTPAAVNVSGLGAKLVYKNVAGVLKTLDGGDIKANIPATLVYSSGQNCYVLNNPSTAAAEGPLTTRTRKEITAAYQMTTADAGNVVSCTGTFTVTLPTAPEGANQFYYVKNKGTGSITIDSQGYKIYGFGSTVGQVNFTLVGRIESVQLQSNGRDWEILTMCLGNSVSGSDDFLTAGAFKWTAPPGVTSVDVEGQGGGGGGAGCNIGGAGSGGTASTIVEPGPATLFTAGGGAGGSGTCSTVNCFYPTGNGGYGGNTGLNYGNPGVSGDYVLDTITVVPGTIYDITVGTGGDGGPGSPSGWNGYPGGSGYIRLSYVV